LGLRESPPDTTIQLLHMSNKILVTLDNQNEVRHLNLLTFAPGVNHWAVLREWGLRELC
jgi:Ser/Thr protein kinase RdoA (MazF antagonist)